MAGPHDAHYHPRFINARTGGTSARGALISRKIEAPSYRGSPALQSDWRVETARLVVAGQLLLDLMHGFLHGTGDLQRDALAAAK